MRALIVFIVLALAGSAVAQDCPKPDRDNDCVADREDACPDVAGRWSSDPKQSGCPVSADSDRDGIPDNSDRCPTEAEDKDGFQDTDGCPDPDNDQDGIADPGDKCPNQAENFNGFEDEDGCPDKGRVIVAPPTQPTTKFSCSPGAPAPDGKSCRCPNGFVSERAAGSAANETYLSCERNTKQPPTVPAPPAGAPAIPANAPTGYRCGPDGKINLGKSCTCGPDRVEKRDSDGVSVCARTFGSGIGFGAGGGRGALMGKLVISTKGTITAGASWADPVSIDGRPLGKTPITTSVPAGKHVITFFRANTTVRKTVSVSVTAGETTSVELVLE